VRDRGTQEQPPAERRCTRPADAPTKAIVSRAAPLEAEPVELDAIDARVLRDREQLANERKEAENGRRPV
jgi:hypothetical protein